MLESRGKVTVDGRHVGPRGISKSRGAGFDDTKLPEIVLAIALRQFCNVIGDALGVEPHFERRNRPA